MSQVRSKIAIRSSVRFLSGRGAVGSARRLGR